jgi:hypothetical protein
MQRRAAAPEAPLPRRPSRGAPPEAPLPRTPSVATALTQEAPSGGARRRGEAAAPWERRRCVAGDEMRCAGVETGDHSLAGRENLRRGASGSAGGPGGASRTCSGRREPRAVGKGRLLEARGGRT